MSRKYSDEDLIREYPNSSSISDLLRRLGLKQAGGSFIIVKKHLVRLGLNPELLSNKPGVGINKNCQKRVSDKDVFCNPTKYKSPSKVKKRALDLGYIKDYCEICKQKKSWNNKPLIMILDHIDGDNKNNNPSNLRSVCPNCDTQLSTYVGKNNKGTV